MQVSKKGTSPRNDESKMPQTFNGSFLKNLVLCNTLRSSIKGDALKNFVIYGGNQEILYNSTMVKSVYFFPRSGLLTSS